MDGAVFILTGADKGWYRGKKVNFPRDNVIFEYGLFVNSLDRKRAIMVCDGGVELPSDISAVTFAHSDSAGLADRVPAHFDETFDVIGSDINSPYIVADPELARSQLEPWPAEWHQRDLYLGIQGARAWLKVVKGPQYVEDEHRDTLRVNQLKAVSMLKVRTFVSLGPGDAEADLQLAQQLQTAEPLLEYIPVDIGIVLLKNAIRRIGREARVPLGIFGDFEDGTQFMRKHLLDRAKPNRLFCLLGNTIGNIDTSERHLLMNLRAMMGKDDHLLLDAVTVGPEWKFETDRRAHHGGYDDNFRYFIAQGLSRRSGFSAAQIVKRFETWVIFTKGTGEVPKTQTVNITDAARKDGARLKSHGPRHVQAHRRYDPFELPRWLEGLGFNVDFKEDYLLKDRAIGHIVVLLSRRGF